MLNKLTARPSNPDGQPCKRKQWTDWLLQAGASGLFLSSAIPKLVGNPAIHAKMDRLGFDGEFTYLLGSVELITALLFLIPGVLYCAKRLAVLTLSLAMFSHLFKLGISYNEQGELYLLTMGSLGTLGAGMVVYRRRQELAMILHRLLNPGNKGVQVS